MSDAPALQLRDIHLPPAPSWWPPAPGWWLLAAGVAAIVVFGVRWLLRRLREQRWRRRVLAELDRIAKSPAFMADPVRLTAEVSQLLRRASILIEPRAGALRDVAWLEFLDEQLPPAERAEAPFRDGAGRALIDAPYRRPDASDAITKESARALLDLARNWLAGVLARRRHRA
jgi:hypothetical protein